MGILICLSSWIHTGWRRILEIIFSREDLGQYYYGVGNLVERDSSPYFTF